MTRSVSKRLAFMLGGADTYLQYQLQTEFSDPVGLDYQTVLLFTATSP